MGDVDKDKDIDTDIDMGRDTKIDGNVGIKTITGTLNDFDFDKKAYLPNTTTPRRGRVEVDTAPYTRTIIHDSMLGSWGSLWGRRHGGLLSVAFKGTGTQD